MSPSASQPQFSSCATGNYPNATSVEAWHEFLCTTFVPLDYRPDRTHVPFRGQVRSMVSGQLHVSRISSSGGLAQRTQAGASRASEEFILLSLQVRGRTIVTQQNRETVLTPGIAAFYDSTAAYSLRMPGDSEQIVLHLPRRLLERRTSWPCAKLATAVRPSMPFAQSMFCLAHQLARFEPDEGNSWISRTAEVVVELLSLLSETMSEESSSAARFAPRASDAALVRRANDLLAMHVSDSDFSPIHLAQRCGVSLRRLQHAFHTSGTTVSRRIWDSRLELAANLLTASGSASESITSIACATGFNDFSHFSRRFKERFELSPRDYRRGATVPSSIA